MPDPDLIIGQQFDSLGERVDELSLPVDRGLTQADRRRTQRQAAEHDQGRQTLKQGAAYIVLRLKLLGRLEQFVTTTGIDHPAG